MAIDHHRADVHYSATNDDAILQKEKRQAFKEKNPDDFKKVVSANLMAVYAEGFSDRQKELAKIAKMGHEVVCNQRLENSRLPGPTQLLPPIR